MDPLDLVGLTQLMGLTSGKCEVSIGLIDGPVALDHPALMGARVQTISAQLSAHCTLADSVACNHGTFVAGILSAKRNGSAPALCPGCTLIVRPIFSENAASGESLPSATPQELATAILECIEAGVRVINLSVALARPSLAGQRELEEALDHAAMRKVLVVAAAGNQGTVGSTAITRHSWVIPVAACDLLGRPMGRSNLGNSIGRSGLSAPGVGVSSLGVDGRPHMLGGTSVATPFVSGAIALLLSLFPQAAAAQVKYAITHSHAPRRASVVPPLLNAWRAYQILATV